MRKVFRISPDMPGYESPEYGDLEDEVNRALDELAVSVNVLGPNSVASHTNHIVSGLAETPEQIKNLCWCLLGFIGDIFNTDLQIDVAIGYGAQATSNLINTLQNRFSISKVLSDEQKERDRDPLLHELIAHVLILIHRRRSILPEWLGDVIACKPPHLNVNSPGLDLIALASENHTPYSIIGEMKAKEKKPSVGLIVACTKFTQMRQGEYNDELRQFYKGINPELGFSRQQLADNIWISESKFGAVIGHDSHENYALDIDFSSRSETVLAQPSDRLFLICTPYERMRDMFDTLVIQITQLALELGNENA